MPFIGHGSYMHADSKTVIHVNERLTGVGSGGRLYYQSVDPATRATSSTP